MQMDKQNCSKSSFLLTNSVYEYLGYNIFRIISRTEINIVVGMFHDHRVFFLQIDLQAKRIIRLNFAGYCPFDFQKSHSSNISMLIPLKSHQLWCQPGCGTGPKGPGNPKLLASSLATGPKCYLSSSEANFKVTCSSSSRGLLLSPCSRGCRKNDGECEVILRILGNVPFLTCLQQSCILCSIYCFSTCCQKFIKVSFFLS